MSAKTKLKTKDHGWDAFWKRIGGLTKLKSARVRVGVLGDTQKGRQQHGAITLAELAAVLHFGTKDGHIPARPFLTLTFDEKRAELKELGAKLMGEVVFGHITLEQALNAMGSKLAADVKNTITAGVAPPNAPSTMLAKAQKGKTGALFSKTLKNVGGGLAQAGALASVKPLIDTGRLLGAINWAVDLNGEK